MSGKSALSPVSGVEPEASYGDAGDRLVAAMDSAMDGIAILDQEERYVYMNRAHAAIFGYEDPGELLGATWRELYDEEGIRRLEEEPRPALFERGRWRGEVAAVKRDGTPFDQELALTLLPEGFMVCVCRDITERKQTERALRDYAKRLEILQEIDRAILAAHSPESIANAALGQIEELIPCLRASVVVFHFDRDEGVLIATRHRGDTQVGTGSRMPLALFDITDELRRGEPNVVADLAKEERGGVIERLRAEGLRSYIMAPLFTQEELIGSLNLGFDQPRAFTGDHIRVAREIGDTLAIAIRQARLYEEVAGHAAQLKERVAERTAELESFSYSVSHDLRSPLRAIDGFSRLLLEEHAEALDPEARRLLGIIQSNARQMGRLIDGLLALSRLGRQELNPRRVEMAGLVRQVYDELSHNEEGRRIGLVMGELPAVQGDPAMVRQILVNLLANAIKFTRPRTEARVEVRSLREGGWVTYSVRDNGVGFDPRYSDKLFGVFQRLHLPEDFEGTGVGLAIVRRITERHGGRVWGQGEVDRGATFYFTLPAVEATRGAG